MPGDLALLVHTHHSRSSEDIRHWRALADQQGGPVLELGCGGGRVSLALAAAGHRVIGLDWDAEMLSILRAETQADPHRRVDAIRADINHFPLDSLFPLILIPCNTLSSLPDPERPVVFRSIAGRLESRGIFAASLPNPEVLRSLPVSGDSELEDEFSHPLTGNPVQVSSGWIKRDDRIEIRWSYDQLFPDGSVLRETASVDHSLAPVEAYAKELADAGLEITSSQGDYDGNPYRPDSPYLIVHCMLTG